VDARPSLDQVVAAFARELPTQVVPASEAVGEEQLLVGLEPDAQGRPRRLELVFLPHDDDLYYLQYFILLPFSAQAEHAADLARVIAAINVTLPLPSFGVSEKEGWIYFRAVVPVSNDRPLDQRLVTDTGWMAYYMVDQFQDVIEAVATGSISFADGVAGVERVLASQPQPGSL
jgi:hypothetical protein